MPKNKVYNHEPYIYGKHPNPTTWHETADVLRNHQKNSKPKHNKSGLSDRLDRIERLIRNK